jgi:hypothetical protein
LFSLIHSFDSIRLIDSFIRFANFSSCTVVQVVYDPHAKAGTVQNM